MGKQQTNIDMEIAIALDIDIDVFLEDSRQRRRLTKARKAHRQQHGDYWVW